MLGSSEKFNVRSAFIGLGLPELSFCFKADLGAGLSGVSRAFKGFIAVAAS